MFFLANTWNLCLSTAERKKHEVFIMPFSLHLNLVDLLAYSRFFSSVMSISLVLIGTGKTTRRIRVPAA